MQLEAAILNDCEFYDRDRVAVLSVPLSLMERLQATETDGGRNLSALGPQIEGVDCAVTMRELRPDVWKMSLRTGPRVNATQACRLLGGGGHAAAAGCTVEAPWVQASSRFSMLWPRWPRIISADRAAVRRPLRRFLCPVVS